MSKKKLIPKAQEGEKVLPSISISTKAPSKKQQQRGQQIMNQINSLKQQGYNQIADQLVEIYNKNGYNAAVNYLLEAQDKLKEDKVINKIINNDNFLSNAFDPVNWNIKESLNAVNNSISNARQYYKDYKNYIKAVIMQETMARGLSCDYTEFLKNLNKQTAYPPLTFEEVKNNFPNEDGYFNIYTFLYDKDSQAKAYYDKGFIPGIPGDYGLVKKAVGQRNLPIYQMYPDEVSRDSLDVVGNYVIPSDNHIPSLLGVSEHRLPKRASIDIQGHPTAVYKHKRTGDLYTKFWDLTDFGQKSAGNGGFRYPWILQKGANLLDKIGSETKAKFNDTPQNGGDFDNDEHLSTITTTTTEQDLVPLINRLDDISRLYKDVLSDWADEFSVLFIESGDNDHE